MKKKIESKGSSSATPRMDKVAYEATTRTIGKWIVPLAKAQHIELELRAKQRENRLLAMLAARTPQFFNPLVAMEAQTLCDRILKEIDNPLKSDG